MFECTGTFLELTDIEEPVHLMGATKLATSSRSTEPVLQQLPECTWHWFYKTANATPVSGMNSWQSTPTILYVKILNRQYDINNSKHLISIIHLILVNISESNLSPCSTAMLTVIRWSRKRRQMTIMGHQNDIASESIKTKNDNNRLKR